MDHTLDGGRTGPYQALRQATLPLQRIAQGAAATAGRSPEIFALLRSGCLITTAVILATLSYGSLEEGMKKTWNLERFPKPRTWEVSLAPHGFFPIEGAHHLDRVLRKFPPTQVPTVWRSTTPVRIAITLPNQDMRVFGRRRVKLAPKEWIRLGEGFEGYEKALVLLDGLPPEAPKKSIWRDPREVRY